MAAILLWELCTEVRGDSEKGGGGGGGQAIQFVVVCDSAIGGGGGGGGRADDHRTMKTTNYKRWGWDQSSNVQMLFEGDPTRPSHPLHVETSNKQGECMLRIRYRICRTLISYYNSSWTYATTHIRSHNIITTQDIAAADALVSLRPMANPSLSTSYQLYLQ